MFINIIENDPVELLTTQLVVWKTDFVNSFFLGGFVFFLHHFVVFAFNLYGNENFFTGLFSSIETGHDTNPATKEDGFFVYVLYSYKVKSTSILMLKIDIQVYAACDKIVPISNDSMPLLRFGTFLI